jgi:hypothetical protein
MNIARSAPKGKGGIHAPAAFYETINQYTQVPFRQINYASLAFSICCINVLVQFHESNFQRNIFYLSLILFYFSGMLKTKSEDGRSTAASLNKQP